MGKIYLGFFSWPASAGQVSSHTTSRLGGRTTALHGSSPGLVLRHLISMVAGTGRIGRISWISIAASKPPSGEDLDGRIGVSLSGSSRESFRAFQ
jgi:hypothetical protein